MAQPIFINVIVPLRVDGTFTYSVPDIFSHEIEIGQRVLVPFGKKKIYTGIIVSIHQQAPSYHTKEIIALLDDKPIVTNHQLLLWEWISRYYMCPIGEVMNAALPAPLKPESQSIIIKGENFTEWNAHNEDELTIISELEKNKTISLIDFQKKIGKKNIHHLLRKWLKNNYIDIIENVKETYKPKKSEFIVLSESIAHEHQIEQWFQKLEKAPKQTDVLLAFFTLNNGQWQNTQPVHKSELLKKANDNGSALKALINKGILKSIWIDGSHIMEYFDKKKVTAVELTNEQEHAKQEILNHFNKKSVVLLHGVTASGKTEIYIKIIEQFLHQQKQILFLLPEIALTSQMVARLQTALGSIVKVYHSKLSERERTELYLHLLSNPDKPYVILGVRSSLFLPFNNLGLIVVDEEHEPTYKQQSPEPYYHARDTAIVLASLHNAKVLLGSATPSLESYFNALTGKYCLVTLSSRFQNIEMPEIKIIDLKTERKKKRISLNYYSQELIDSLKQNLEAGKQSIIFQNRRGYAPYLECESCGWVPGCQHCDVKLTYHKSLNKLICHYCGYSISIPHFCNECSLPELKIRGIGTERIEDELALLIPNATIARFDLDTTRTSRKIDNLLNDIAQNKINILVGTQMITKGLDFDNVTLIGIIDADSMLNYPDFRTNERTFQLFAQVAGRAGRRNQQGKVLIQTTQPQHFVLQYLKSYDFTGFAEWQLSERKRFNYPPYVRLLKIIIKHKQAEFAKKVAKSLTDILKQHKQLIVIGPQSPIVSKINDYYIMEIWLKLNNTYNQLSKRDMLFQTIHQFFTRPEYKSILWKMDVDPI
ncbi:MAG: primosomal protein N' [Bacteroidales bacterium]|nr:primosomal protein N' [Bacteroidales bacterium]